MMATPADLEDFAVGFALSEGIIERLDDIRAIEVAVGRRTTGGSKFRFPENGMSAHLARKRAMSGRTGCGVCGVEDLAHLPTRRAGRPRRSRSRPRRSAPPCAALESAQPLNARTRAVHAAAWCEPDGAIRCVREDVGRHNALDKLIGALLRAGVDPETASSSSPVAVRSRWWRRRRRSARACWFRSRRRRRWPCVRPRPPASC